ncbi:hypothetical protein BQ9231_00042 [Cedratvirus lausannensis]|uniref:Uncharacterized protein n=1 Tax=Cedratvirus lausannensis TaxID=2023205 RepID=A0A285Q153_9VIRU|nr:hypothetical protein BQ9231_00042 [Cedratvirus lausannensis]
MERDTVDEFGYMRRDNLLEKKADLDTQVVILQEQLLLVEDKKERARLYSTLDALLAEQMQMDDYLAQEEVRAPETGVANFVNQFAGWGDDEPSSTPLKSFESTDHARSVGDKLADIEPGRLVMLSSASSLEFGFRWYKLLAGDEETGYFVEDEIRDTIIQVSKELAQERWIHRPLPNSEIKNYHLGHETRSLDRIEKKKMVKLLKPGHALCEWFLYFGKDREGNYILWDEYGKEVKVGPGLACEEWAFCEPGQLKGKVWS